MSGVAKFGKPSPAYGGVAVRQIGIIENVSYLNPFVGAIPAPAAAWLARLMVRNVAPGATWGTKIEIFERNPAAPDFDEDLDAVYHDDRYISGAEMLDDRLTRNLFLNATGDPLVWVRLTPENGTSNRYKIRFDWILVAAASALPPIP